MTPHSYLWPWDSWYNGGREGHGCKGHGCNQECTHTGPKWVRIQTWLKTFENFHRIKQGYFLDLHVLLSFTRCPQLFYFIFDLAFYVCCKRLLTLGYLRQLDGTDDIGRGSRVKKWSEGTKREGTEVCHFLPPIPRRFYIVVVVVVVVVSENLT